jgi:hypothetical protein
MTGLLDIFSFKYTYRFSSRSLSFESSTTKYDLKLCSFLYVIQR